MHTTTTSNNNNKTNGTSGGVGGKVGVDRDGVSNGGLSIEKGQKRKCDGSFFIRHKKKRKGVGRFEFLDSRDSPVIGVSQILTIF